VGVPAVPVEIGTAARVVDWHRYDDGILGITAVGTERFRVLETEVRPDRLLVGRCEFLTTASAPLPADASDLAAVALGLLERVGHVYATLPRAPEDAAWVGHRLAELLPLPNPAKQALLELDDPRVLLAELRAALRALEGSRPT
jgi:Lon protease-like protein